MGWIYDVLTSEEIGAKDDEADFLQEQRDNMEEERLWTDGLPLFWDHE